MKHDLFTLTTGNHINFLIEGEVFYDSFLKLIREAKKEIHLQTYIFEMDLYGYAVQKELIGAASRGVDVYLLVDRFGSMNLTNQFIRELRDAGVNFCQFNPIQFKWLGKFGRRLHHKILLVDQLRSLVSGINLMSSSFRSKEIVPRLDFAVCLKGAVIRELTSYCQQIYLKAAGTDLQFASFDQSQSESFDPNMKIKISINDWTSRRRQIAKQYSRLIKSSKSDILIINSYFFPRRKFMKQLVLAAKNGVRVRLILPKYSDWPEYVLASQYLYSYFLKNKVDIYQWKNSILHGKLATFDGKFSTIGSFNLNYTSYQENLEMNVDVVSELFTNELNLKIEDWIANGCEKIDGQSFMRNSTFKERFLRHLFYLMLSLTAKLTINMAFIEARSRRMPS